jgi:hypothetical protein
MKTALLKTAFVIVVLLLTIVFLVPTKLLVDAMIPTGRNGVGPHRNVDMLLPGVIEIFFCMYVANRITSYLFLRARLSDERWSFLTPDRR